MVSQSLCYFAYGSNADPDRFRARVGEWLDRAPAWLEGYRLRFASSVRSEGGGGAVIDEAEGSRVAGVLYEITREQMERMDREEFDPARDVSRSGRRLTVTVSTGGGVRTAQAYTVSDDGGWCAPSETYLAHILRGLEAAGHSPEVIASARDIASGSAR
jgi:cation transport regulator ChaC